MSRTTGHGIRQLSHPSDDELLKDIKQAEHAGSQDLLGAEYSARQPVQDTRIDKQEYYGDFYDELQPEIKKLDNNLSRSLLFNGDTFDRARNNQDFVLFNKQNYVNPGTQYESRTIVNHNARGCILVVNSFDLIFPDTFFIQVEGLEVGSGNWYIIGTGEIITGQALYVYKIYPGLNPNMGKTWNDILPRQWRVTVRFISTASAINFGISGSLII